MLRVLLALVLFVSGGTPGHTFAQVLPASRLPAHSTASAAVVWPSPPTLTSPASSGYLLEAALVNRVFGGAWAGYHLEMESAAQLRAGSSAALPAEAAYILAWKSERLAAQLASRPGLYGVGFLGSALGLLIGVPAGFAVERALYAHDDEYSGLLGAFLGAAAGTALLPPVAVHLANGRRGNLAVSLGASAGAGALVVGNVFYRGTDGAILFALPLVQVVMSVEIERSTSTAP